MNGDDLKARLAKDPVKVECPICRHRQWLSAPEGRCGQCGSEIALFADRQSATAALDRVIADGRVAFLTEAEGGLFAVVANRTFRKGSP